MFKSNEYFDGKVVSIAFQGEALPATVGVMAAGEYEFSTAQKETMTVISGAMTVQLPGRDDWITYRRNDSFVVAANTRFKLKIEQDSAYLCTYE
ncbi:MAG: hypothetical protein CMK83_25990 [Pseudomonadales bacterium]|jgi:purine/pyrimidine-nucleoside phosphorylase|uniref:pyrimidine/purine nucleoside phosphorylase n=1 Tax=unclassified Ketobacter TaxID=2639109 RepID=UPI000C40BDFF|nr:MULTISPECIES: pyrimidine/purine nucleoside phosphorylase [unclassified Ketobacter]MAA60600.1 hypothetical protein [Pseudomonadales bacterium]MEC8811319.1 pyrimidine/purine nucleoside phosphorylase [Pseudomonadota bacterium]TNC88549.1 MAG: hypothetical protein CSH49_11100 [Alcanivorax sp.]HAG96303.1 hypothetical protein [Gammaproteobacteria bacterium]MAQ27674.1 hypothetical protein [Pseudomonadales bacterium]|tara:strand:+ start:14626 stop:14907 length:282 start_codon:yes stop_codon:yes gene_type:complete